MAKACRVLRVSRAGYYQHLAQAQEITDLEARVRLRAAFSASGKNYGSRRLACALQNQDLAISRYKVRTLMRKEGLKPVWKRKFLHTTDSRHGLYSM